MYTFPNSNMPIEIGYNVFYSQLLRYSGICSHVSSFVSSSNKLYLILVNRSYNHWKLVLKFRVLLKNYPNILLKYKICDSRIIEKDIFKIKNTALNSVRSAITEINKIQKSDLQEAIRFDDSRQRFSKGIS